MCYLFLTGTASNSRMQLRESACVMYGFIVHLCKIEREGMHKILSQVVMHLIPSFSVVFKKHQGWIQRDVWTSNICKQLRSVPHMATKRKKRKNQKASSHDDITDRVKKDQCSGRPSTYWWPIPLLLGPEYAWWKFNVVNESQLFRGLKASTSGEDESPRIMMIKVIERTKEMIPWWCCFMFIYVLMVVQFSSCCSHQIEDDGCLVKTMRSFFRDTEN